MYRIIGSFKIKRMETLEIFWVIKHAGAALIGLGTALVGNPDLRINSRSLQHTLKYPVPVPLERLHPETAASMPRPNPTNTHAVGADDTFELWDLKVEVVCPPNERIFCGAKDGDHFFLEGEMLKLPPGQGISIYSLSTGVMTLVKVWI